MSVLATSQPRAALFADLPVTIGQAVLLRETADDVPFLRRLYRSTREHELAGTGWLEPVKQSFCDSQFDLQRAHYLRHYPAAEFLIVRVGMEPVGRIYLDTSGGAVHIVDLALLSPWRSRGIGSALIEAVQQRAAASGRAVSLQVLVWNRRAIALYRRFGFAAGKVTDSHMAMRWNGFQLNTAS